MANTETAIYDRLWVLYTASLVIVVILFLILKSLLLRLYFDGYGDLYMHIYDFIFQCWPIQFLSTWLFVIGVMFWLLRYRSFSFEYEVCRVIKFQEDSIVREEAPKLIDRTPDKYHKTLALRRFRELLHAFSHGEDIIRLNEELSRRDLAEIEQGHSILDTIRNLIPVLGFLGTVIGLSLGMVAFPDIENIELLRKALRSFAGSLSVAFNTTLLALVYTIVIILLTSFLRQREEVLVRNIDEQARNLVGKTRVPDTSREGRASGDLSGIRDAVSHALAIWREELSTALKEVVQNLSDHKSSTSNDLERVMREFGKIISSKLDDLKEGIKQPPHYQIIVKPLKEQRDEEQ